MARYVLLRIKDNKLADQLVEQIKEHKGIYVAPGLMVADGDDVWVPLSVRGLWAVPTQFCECGGSGGKGYTRGRKYGWWVHATCKKPNKLWAEGHDWYRSLGTNLLPISDDCPDWRGPGHKQHPGYTQEVKVTGEVRAYIDSFRAGGGR